MAGRYDTKNIPVDVDDLVQLAKSAGGRFHLFASKAHMMRFMYAKGFMNKRELIELLTEVLEAAEKGDGPEEVRKWREALDEVNGLPDDDPQQQRKPRE